MNKESSQEFNIGEKVTYVPTNEHGIIKSFNSLGLPFVIYNCENNWEMKYPLYGAQLTYPDDLVKGWENNTK